MTREIKFRGKSTDTREWVYGDLLHIAKGNLIYFGSSTETTEPYIEMNSNVAVELFIDEIGVVNKESIGQFTGKTDKNKKYIYEGDIVKVYAKDGTFDIVVKWDNDAMAFMACYVDGNQGPFSWFTNLLVYELEVIGNVFDNPDLIIRNDNGDNTIREKT